MIDWLSSSTPPCDRISATTSFPLIQRTSNNDDAIISTTAIKQSSISNDTMQEKEERVESSNGHVKDDNDLEDGYKAM